MIVFDWYDRYRSGVVEILPALGTYYFEVIPQDFESELPERYTFRRSPIDFDAILGELSEDDRPGWDRPCWIPSPRVGDLVGKIIEGRISAETVELSDAFLDCR